MAFYLQRLMNIVPRWQMLNAISRIRIFQSSYYFFFLVPIAARLIRKIGPELEMNLFGAVFHVSLGLPFSWKVFYFSSFFFVVAISIYWLKCPKLIKDFRNFREFQEEGRGQETIKNSLIEYLELTSNHLREGLGNLFIADYCEPSTMSDSEYLSGIGLADLTVAKVTDSTIKPEKLSEAFWFTRRITNGQNHVVRIFCFSFYLLAFLLLGYVLIQNFIYVWKLTF